MKLELAYYGNPVLRKKTKQVEKIDDELRQFIENMIQAMHEFNGIGLAAPQVNQLVAVFVTCVPIAMPEGKWGEGTNRVFINPKILSYSEEMQTISEGCLSIPKLYVDINRPLTIQIEAMDITGNIFQETLTGLHAANFMHENDHLNGVLIIDRMDRKERKTIENKLREIKNTFSKK